MSGFGGDLQDSHRQAVLERWRRCLWWAGLILLCAAAAIIYGIGWRVLPPLLIGTVVVSPAMGVYTSLSAGLCCWIGMIPLLDDDLPSTAGMLRKLRHVTAVTFTVLGLLSILPMAWVTQFSESQYRVLSPASPEGCHVVTSMAPMLFGTAGYVYLSTPGSIVLHQVHTSWWSYWWSNATSETGYDPIDAGEWSLRWQGDQGHLSITVKGSAKDGGSSVLTCQHR